MEQLDQFIPNGPDFLPFDSIANPLSRLLAFAMAALVLLAIGNLIFAGFLYLFSGDDASKGARARQRTKVSLITIGFVLGFTVLIGIVFAVGNAVFGGAAAASDAPAEGFIVPALVGLNRLKRHGESDS